MGYLIKSRIPHPTRIHNWAQDLQMLSGRLCWLFAILRQYWCRCDRLFWDKLLRGHGLTGVTRLGTRENWVCRHVWGISYSVHLYIYIYTHTHACIHVTLYIHLCYAGLCRPFTTWKQSGEGVLPVKHGQLSDPTSSDWSNPSLSLDVCRGRFRFACRCKSYRYG